MSKSSCVKFSTLEIREVFKMRLRRSLAKDRSVQTTTIPQRADSSDCSNCISVPRPKLRRAQSLDRRRSTATEKGVPNSIRGNYECIGRILPWEAHMNREKTRNASRASDADKITRKKPRPKVRSKLVINSTLAVQDCSTAVPTPLSLSPPKMAASAQFFDLEPKENVRGVLNVEISTPCDSARSSSEHPVCPLEFQQLSARVKHLEGDPADAFEKSFDLATESCHASSVAKISLADIRMLVYTEELNGLREQYEAKLQRLEQRDEERLNELSGQDSFIMQQASRIQELEAMGTAEGAGCDARLREEHASRIQELETKLSLSTVESAECEAELQKEHLSRIQELETKLSLSTVESAEREARLRKEHASRIQELEMKLFLSTEEGAECEAKLQKEHLSRIQELETKLSLSTAEGVECEARLRKEIARTAESGLDALKQQQQDMEETKRVELCEVLMEYDILQGELAEMEEQLKESKAYAMDLRQQLELLPMKNTSQTRATRANANH